MRDANSTNSKLLTAADFGRAALALGCEVAAIRAVEEVESPGGGFLEDGTTPVILFEGHWFHALTHGIYSATHPDISYPRWTKKYYVGGIAEHQRLQRAVALDRNAALASASWGNFQVMGFNWRIAGCTSLQDFINAMYRSEGAHLDCFVNTVKAMGLDDELRDHRWEDFAEVYNGPGHRQNNYAPRMAQAHDAWTRRLQQIGQAA
jgi:hypothetical protein